MCGGSFSQGGAMNIRILSVGKIKERYFADAVREYVKRISRYARVQITEAADEKTPDGASASLAEQIRMKEGRRLLSYMKETDYVIALAIDGKMYDSEKLARHIEELMGSGKSTIDLVIGGSLGLSQEVLDRSDEQVSFSALTFPHQLMRVILLEQVYRAFRIMHHEPYHK